jgi:hypothetical protein
MINQTRHKRNVTKSLRAGHTVPNSQQEEDRNKGSLQVPGYPCYSWETPQDTIRRKEIQNNNKTKTQQTIKENLGLKEQQKTSWQWAGFSLITKGDLE